jgi:hypothetical protein
MYDASFRLGVVSVSWENLLLGRSLQTPHQLDRRVLCNVQLTAQVLGAFSQARPTTKANGLSLAPGFTVQ